jgi:arginine exporter protein ArgO
LTRVVVEDHRQRRRATLPTSSAWQDDENFGCAENRRLACSRIVTDALISGLLAGYGVAIPVGAIGVLIISLSARESLRVGAGAALGVATADGLYALVAVLGGAAVAALVRPIATPLRIVAGVVLLGLAVQIAVTAWRHARDPSREVPRSKLSSGPRAFAGVLGLTILNPATIIYFAALVLGQKATGITVSRSAELVFVVAVFVASASWQLLLAIGGSALGRTLSGPRGRLVTALVSSAVIVVLAIRTLIG